ncbi:polysaccharide deacetylase [Natranaerobius trueperi]|uniref:Polysaccharide deacetylase n=1 Tax=Natranaerobius trueperi TaxID=759412 RepID=A0A226C2I1_9FIRM|nr:polysaccharide deacetylase [Natranaerobius trueperi]
MYSVDTEEKKISISFDAAWGAERTPDILDILDKYDIKTTFFVTGFWLENYPDVAEEISERGHEVENHSLTHPHMTNLDEQQIREEVERVHHQLYDITGEEPILFRPPFGDYDDLLVETLEDMDYYPIQWSIDSLDWQAPDANYIESIVLDEVEPGEIVLFHNNGTYTPEAVDNILKELIKEQGYEVVPISELIYKDNYYVEPTNGLQVPEN